MRSTFYFKQFHIVQSKEAMKVGTDGVLLGAWARAEANYRQALDIGTGTGVIALMFAQRYPDLSIIGVEQSKKAVELASLNFNSSPWSDRLQVYSSTIQNFAKNTEQTYDCIVSNPPFFTQGTPSSNTAKSQMRHTLLLPFDELLDSVNRLLSPNGRFSLILPLEEGLEFKSKATDYGLYASRRTNVYPKLGKPIERLLLEFKRGVGETKEDDLVIETSQRHVYTDAYIQLTKDFYLKM